MSRGLIRDLRSSDAEVRSAAMYELYGNIYHQSTRYEASAYAVPFLLELLADPATPARHEVIQLLSCLAVGYTPYDIPARGFPIGKLRNDVTQVPEETWRRWSQAMKDWYGVVRTGQRQPPPLTRSELRLIERRHALAAYDAVRAGVPVLLTCLTDPDAEVIGEAIHALAWFSEESTSIRPRLLEIASDDQRPAWIVGAALIALGLVGGTLTQPVAGREDDLGFESQQRRTRHARRLRRAGGRGGAVGPRRGGARRATHIQLAQPFQQGAGARVPADGGGSRPRLRGADGAAAGLPPPMGPPASVLFSPGVPVRFGPPATL